MKRKYKYIIMVVLFGFVGSFFIYAFSTGRFDLWNLPDGLFRMFLASTIIMCLIGGILTNLVENQLDK